MLVAMFDVQCPKCSKRFGWGGTLIQRPPCPRCGHTIPKEELEKQNDNMEIEQAKMDLEEHHLNIAMEHLKPIREKLVKAEAGPAYLLAESYYQKHGFKIQTKFIRMAILKFKEQDYIERAGL